MILLYLSGFFTIVFTWYLFCELLYGISLTCRKKNVLPGIMSLWDVAHYWIVLYLGMPNYLILEKLEKYFGPVYQYKFGSSAPTIAVMDIGLAKKIMSSPDCLNRLPEGHVLYERSFKKPLGILFGNGNNWAFCRNFASKTLHNLGFGRGARLEYYISTEVEDTIQKLEEVTEKGELFQPHGFFHVPTLNILWYLIAGTRFSHDDPELQELLKYFYAWNRSFNLGATILHSYPWLRHIPGLTEHDSWVNGHAKFFQFFKKIMKERRAQGKYTDDPENFIDYFLCEIDKNSSSEENYFTEENFLTVCTDLFMAGADTTSNSLEYTVLFMTLSPHVQRQVQEEIQTVFGDRLPSLNFKNLMPYTEATTLEILRHSCTIPVTGRCPVTDMHINGAPVMKDSLIAINIHGIHYNKKIWSDPESFRPERFLCPEGKITNRDKIIPFGHGKRKCLGESTSRNTFFLFFVSMLQKFSFELSPGHPAPSLQQVCGLSRAPKPFSVKIMKRQCPYDDNFNMVHGDRKANRA